MLRDSAVARDRASACVDASRGARPTTLFAERAAATGLVFTHVNGAAGGYYLPEMMGAGVALFDFDNDGDLDVFLVQGGRSTRRRSAAPADVPPVSQRSHGGRRTAAARFASPT